MNLTSLIILEWINNIIQVILYTLLISALLTPKRSRLMTAIVYSICFVGITIGTYSFKTLVALKAPIFIVFDLLYILFMYNNKRSYKLFVVIFKFLLMVISDIFTMFFFNFLWGSSSSLSYSDYSVERIISLMFFEIVFLSFSTIAVFFIRKLKLNLSIGQLPLFILFPVTQILLLVGTFFKDISHVSVSFIAFEMVAVVFAIASNVYIFNVLWQMNEKSEIQQKLAILENLRETDAEYYSLMQHHDREISAIRHDFKDQLATAYALAEAYNDSDRETAIKLISTLETKIDAIKLPVICENRVINTILNVKIEQASNEGIIIETALEVPNSITVEKADLCGVFSNILNNAIEACRKVSESQKKIISVKSTVKSGYLIIKVTNPKFGNPVIENGKLITAKKDRKSHGFGMEIIKSIAEKYAGQLDYSFDANLFTTTVSLQVSVVDVV